MGRFYHYCPRQEARPFLIEAVFQSGTEKKEIDALRKQYIEKNCYTVAEIWELEGWKLYKTDVSVKEHLKISFPMRQDQLLDKIKSGALFR